MYSCIECYFAMLEFCEFVNFFLIWKELRDDSDDTSCVIACKSELIRRGSHFILQWAKTYSHISIFFVWMERGGKVIWNFIMSCLLSCFQLITVFFWFFRAICLGQNVGNQQDPVPGTRIARKGVVLSRKKVVIQHLIGKSTITINFLPVQGTVWGVIIGTWVLTKESVTVINQAVLRCFYIVLERCLESSDLELWK